MTTRLRSASSPYTPEDYDALRAGLDDGAKLPPAYETWRVSTEQMQREFEGSGVDVERVSIVPAPFAARCGGAGRARYAAKAVASAR